MNKDYNKGKKMSGIFFKIFVPMVILIIFQFCTFILVLLFSGEFKYIKDYSQSILIEKTENRRNYIQTELQQKMPLVLETAETINSIVEQTLKDNNASIQDITTNKDLNKQILENSTESIISLLRRNMVNDVFLILESGSLYNEDNISAKTGLLIRDLDPFNSSMSNNKDLLMEMGSSAIAQNFNITLDSGWTPKLIINNIDNYDFYLTTIQTAIENPNEELENLGYWSGFSNISENVTSSQPSIKYSIPLIDDNGNIYGVLGIGIMEKILLKDLPSNDLLNENACYILGYDNCNLGEYSILLHSGSIYHRIFNDNDTIKYSDLENTDIFKYNSKLSSIGSIQDIALYSDNSKFKNNQRWALISIADKNNVLKVYNSIIDTSLISCTISIVVGLVVLIFISKKISTPISNIINKLNTKERFDQIIQFNTTNIAEIDQLTNSITNLQTNVKEYASRVSKIISIADIGLGVFTWDYITDMVFIGESLISLLNFKDLPQEDTFITFNQFTRYISRSNHTNNIISPLIKIKNTPNIKEVNINESINFEIGSNLNKKYFRFDITKDNNNIIGVIQDITNVVLERQKIEYERDYDLTTGLLNRRAYYKKIEQLFKNPKSLRISAFIMWDLDNLKYVNDTYGHDFGDDYIKTAANIFKQFKNHNGVVARMSGDEFNIFLSGYNSKEEILEVVNKVRDNLLNSYCLLSDGTHFKIRASGGIAYYPYDSKSYEMLIKYADFAMYSIKHSTKGALAEFDISTYNKDSILITGIEEMNRIIDEHSIKYAFQSIISAKTGEIYGYEALMRPQSNILKSPLELIRIAKASSKLYKIEHLTWITALSSFHKQINEGKAPKNTKIFLNSISNCIINSNDIKYIDSVHGDILENLVMEILEGEQTNMSFMNIKFKLIKHWNGMIALDDFGSGYNNELALITFNPNLIKIDHSIISGCDNDTNRQNIITNLIKIAKAKNILVLAEGVETYDELKTVINCGVDLIQGYYVSRPVFELQDVPIDIKKQIKALNIKPNEVIYE